MHPAHNIAALRVRGTSCNAIARQLGVSRAAVSMVINHPNNRSRRIERAIADALGERPADVFTDRADTPAPADEDAA